MADPIEYRCPVCGFSYFDHGPESGLSTHRRFMAAYRVATWEQAEALADAGKPTTSDDPSWDGQECGDRSAQPDGESCHGRLVRVYEN